MNFTQLFKSHPGDSPHSDSHKRKPKEGNGTLRDKLSSAYLANQKGNLGHAGFNKRIFDIIVGGLNLLILSPIMLLIAVLIKLESRGPVLYVSKRMGSGGKVFNFYKFRSMRKDADAMLHELSDYNKYGEADKKDVFVKIHKDPRITFIGKIIRWTSLDELPQLFNVLSGEMSIVGNRPLPLYEAREVIERGWSVRFQATCGITGMWQTMPDKDRMSCERRAAIDMKYAKNNSLLGDMIIMAKTPFAMLQNHSS